MNRNELRFPSGEVWIFEGPDAVEGEPAQPMVLVSHIRATGDTSTDDLTGSAMQDMPPPFEPAAE